MNVRPETTKLLEENIGGQLLDISLGDDFLDTKSKSNNSKYKHVGLHQSKSFCTAKETINKIKRQLTEWEKIFANHTSDKALISKIYKEFK